jgi:hypothetical protein
VEVDEPRDEEAAKGLAVRPPTSVLRAVGPPEATIGPLATVRPRGGGGAVRPPGAAVRPLAPAQNGNPRGTRSVVSGAGIGATLQELSCRKMSKSLVRWDIDSLCDRQSIQGRHIWWTGVLVYEVLGRRGMDSRHNRTPVSAHRRGRHRGERHMGRIHGLSC